MQSFRVHHVNFYKPEANAIHCLSYDDDTYGLALSRSDNSIEVWDLRNAPCQRQVFPCYQGYSVESLAWCGSRLFCTGLSAYIQEYSSSSLLPKSSTPVNGGSTWCLAVSKDRTHLAAGTEDGYICLFNVTDDGIEFERNFDNQEGRILCLAWHESGQTIVSGSTDIIRIWNVATGYAVDRILVGRIDKKTETTIWCISVLGDGTIVSGDSYGRTSFWDSKTGTLINAARDHKADVLALCVSKDGSVYTSGVDPIIFEYTQVCLQPLKSSESVWVKSGQYKGHTHDVRALTFAGPYLASGGADTYLTLSLDHPKQFRKFPPLLQNSAFHLASRARCLLLQYSKNLEIWKLGSSKKIDDEGDGEMLPLSTNEKKALQLSVKDGEHIVCSAISEDARWFAYSTLECLRLFYFTLEDEGGSQVSNATLQKVKHLPAECQTATLMCFTSSGDRLIVASGNKIAILSTNLIQPSLVHVFSDNTAGNVFHRLCCSRRDKFVASADLSGRVAVYNMQDYSVHCSLPHHQCLSTAMVFHSCSGNLFVAYADQTIVEYDLTKKAYTPWTRKLMQQENPFLDQYSPVLGITFGHEKTVILHDHQTVYSIRMDHLLPSTVKRPRQQGEEDPICNSDIALNSSKRYKHLVALSQLDDDELVAIEVLPSEIFKQLPPSLKRKKFGT